MKYITFAIVMVGLSGCAVRQKILDAPAVSMKVASLQPNQKLKPMGDVKGQFCANSLSDSGSVGLMDMAIKDAEKKYGCDVITNATFFDTGGCVELEGTGNKIQ